MRYQVQFSNSGQHLFDRSLSALLIASKLLIKAVVYLPLLFAGYIISERILKKEDSAFAWIGLILLFTYAFYLLVYFLKGALIALKHEGNLLWFPVLFLCLTFTCIMPVWIAFDSIEEVMLSISHSSAKTLTWIFAIAFGVFVYSRYHFLTNIAPLAVYPIYQAGINIALNLMRIPNGIKAVRSRQII